MKKRKWEREREKDIESEWNNVQKIGEHDESKAAVLNLLLTLLFFLLQSVHLFRYNISRVAIDFTRGIVLWCIARTGLRRRGGRGRRRSVSVRGRDERKREAALFLHRASSCFIKKGWANGDRREKRIVESESESESERRNSAQDTKRVADEQTKQLETHWQPQLLTWRCHVNFASIFIGSLSLRRFPCLRMYSTQYTVKERINLSRVCTRWPSSKVCLCSGWCIRSRQIRLVSWNQF